MSSLFILIPVAFVILLIAIGIFYWAVRDGQYDDLRSPAKRIIIDDKEDKDQHD